MWNASAVHQKECAIPAVTQLPRRSLRALLLGPLLLTVLAACGGGEEKAQGPPRGLDSIVLPADAESVVAVLEGLPADVGGLARSPAAATPLSPDVLLASERVDVGYGGTGARAGIGVVSLDATRAFAEDPELTLADFLKTLAESGDVEVEAQQLDPDVALLYVAYTGTSDGQAGYNVAWGAPDGLWFFTASADTPDMRAALLAVFVASVRAASP